MSETRATALEHALDKAIAIPARNIEDNVLRMRRDRPGADTAELVELALVLDIDLICFVEKERYDEIIERRRQVIEEFGTGAGTSDLRQVRR